MIVESTAETQPTLDSKNLSIYTTDFDNKSSSNEKMLVMEESSHTFGPTRASAPGPDQSKNAPVMIADTLKDVRTNLHIDPKELDNGH